MILSYWVDKYIFCKNKDDLELLIINYPYIIEIWNNKYNTNFKKINYIYYYIERNKYYFKDFISFYSLQYILLFSKLLYDGKRDIIQINKNIILKNKFLIFNSILINEILLYSRKYELNKVSEFLKNNLNFDIYKTKGLILENSKYLENNKFERIYNKEVEEHKLVKAKPQKINKEKKYSSFFSFFKCWKKNKIDLRLENSLKQRNLEIEVLK